MALFDCTRLRFDGVPELWAKLEWTSDLWLFVAGAELPAPRFPYCEAVPAVLRGYRRRPCVRSGGRMLSTLDRGGTCRGIAYRVPAVDAPAALGALAGRERQSGAFRLGEVTLEFEVGGAAAFAFVANPGHRAYTPEAVPARPRLQRAA